MNLPRWLKWLPRLRRKLYTMGWYLFFTFPFLSFFFFFLIFFLTITLSVPIGVDVGTKESELAIAEEAKKPTPIVQTTEAQPRIPHTV